MNWYIVVDKLNYKNYTFSSRSNRDRSSHKHKDKSDHKNEYKKKKSSSKQRSSSCSSSSSDSSDSNKSIKLLERLKTERIKHMEVRKQQKEVMKANETPEEKRYAIKFQKITNLFILNIVG